MSLPETLLLAALAQVAGVAAAVAAALWTLARDKGRGRRALDQQATRDRARCRRLLVFGVRRIEAALARIKAESHPLLDVEPRQMLQAAVAVFDHALGRPGTHVPLEPIVAEALLGMRALLVQGAEIADRVVCEVPILLRRIEPEPSSPRPEEAPLMAPPPGPSAEERNAQRAPELEWRLHTARRLLDDFDRGLPSF